MLYDFKDTKTGEIVEVNLRLSELDTFKQENPHMERYFSTMNFQDSVSLGIKRPPIEFKEGVIDKIKRSNPGHKMESRWD